ncbi:uncharacterized protein [Malus domestica]|uniref:uncharacterized protein n=1 Tax=Malus domestica TaxID=3750 RepID=UPI003975D568
MEELHRAALAYYNNGDRNLQLLASNFFQSMDQNGDGIVNLAEFVTFLQQNGYGWIGRNFFYDLDRNLVGGLDFHEVLTFYYIIKTRNLWCRRCGVWLTGLYFTCVECFDGAPDNYDLCSGCYSGRGLYTTTPASWITISCSDQREDKLLEFLVSTQAPSAGLIECAGSILLCLFLLHGR